MARIQPPVQRPLHIPTQLNAILDATTDFVATADTGAKTLFLNRSARALLGLSPETEVRGIPFSHWLADASVERLIRQALPEAARVGSWSGESCLLTVEGREIPVSQVILAHSDREGEVEYFSFICRDISEIKGVEAALRESEARHRSIFDHSIDAVLLTKPDTGEILSANPAASRMMGYGEGEMVGLGREDIVDITDPRLPQALEERERTGRFRGELTMKRADGTRFPGEVSSSEFTNASGSPRTSLIVRDVTRRKAAEEALHQSETNFRDLFESITESVSIQHRDGSFLDVNPAFLAMYGYRRDEIIGQLPGMLSDPDRVDFQATMALFNQALSGKPQRFEWWGRRRSGECFPQEIVFTRGKYYGDEVVISVAREVSDQRNLELQLRQSQKMEAVGRLAGGVAHDFNNLLTVIRGNAEILQSELQDSDERLEEVVEIAEATRRAAELTHQLLAFSRQQVLMPKVLNLNAVLTDTQKMLRRLIGEDVDLVVTLDPELNRTLADPGQIQQVLMNLVINARDAMPKGGALSLETRNQELTPVFLRKSGLPSYIVPGSYVELAVGDTGTGIDRTTMSRLFEPFFTTKEAGKGTGLGLSTVYGIIKQSDGFVWAESRMGKGSTFRILLPRVEGSAEPERELESAISRTEKEQGSETILLVEDEVSVRRLVRRVLERAGYTVLEALDGEDAFRICARHADPIHLLVTDVIMPGVSGTDVAEGVELLRPETRVLYISGYTDDALSEHGVTGSEIHFLHKPFSSEALLAHVRKVLEA